MSEIKTNREFMKTLTDLCKKHRIDEDWVTQRQASRYRNKKGRIYNKIQAQGGK